MTDDSGIQFQSLHEEYLYLWNKVMSRFDPSAKVLIESSLAGASVPAEAHNRLLNAHKDAIKLRAELDQLTKEYNGLLQTASIADPEDGPSQDEQEHSERISDLLVGMIVNLGRDYTKYPDLQLIMYDQVYKGVSPRPTSQ